MKLAEVPLKVTERAPVNCVPEIVTVVPTEPLVGEKPLIEMVGAATGWVACGGVATVKPAVSDAVPAGVATVIVPLVAPSGTVALSCESFSTWKDAETPLKATAVAPVRCDPVIFTVVPAVPAAGAKSATAGAAAGADGGMTTGRLPPGGSTRGADWTAAG